MIHSNDTHWIYPFVRYKNLSNKSVYFQTRFVKETTPTYEAARNCVLDDTQTLDQTSELPRDNIDAENALREIREREAIEARTGRPVFLPVNPLAETSASSESSASATSSASSTASSTAPLTPTSIINDDESIPVRQYRDSFAFQAAPNVPTEQTATSDQHVDAVDDHTDIIQMGNVVTSDPPIRKRAAEAPRTQTLSITSHSTDHTSATNVGHHTNTMIYSISNVDIP
jgi:hypothetical protein